MNSIFHRVSIRKYTDQKVEEEKIMQMLRAAMAAPSACNQQPWEFYVVTNPEKIKELSRQRSNHYAFRAGRNVPDKEFRYLRTVIVTAAVYRGFNSLLPLTCDISS